MNVIDPRERLIVALDYDSTADARRAVDSLGDAASFYKVGLTLQLAPGVEGLIRHILDTGKRVFLDYKYYDIAPTLEKAVARAADLGVSFLTIHGTTECIQGAVRGRGSCELKLFAVTVLTTHDQADLAELGYSEHTVSQLVIHRAKKAIAGGCDGVIASGQEAAEIKKLGGSLLVITPGIRPDGYPEDDQKRRTTPRDAILAGADYLVMGRPITGAADPRAAAEMVVEQVRTAFLEAAR
jgi:orotidine-5'-phosphate decarboxylase